MTATDAASVAVKTPPRMPPMMMTGATSAGSAAQNERSTSRPLNRIVSSRVEAMNRARVKITMIFDRPIIPAGKLRFNPSM